MKTKLTVLLLILMCCWQPGYALDNGISMMFSDTDVAQVLKAVSVRTKANIVYSGKEKIKVSLNAKVETTEDAIKSVTSAAGLVYRKVNDTYIVASATDMRQALAPYAYTVTFNPGEASAEDVAEKLQAAVPYATITAVGSKITMTGVMEDIRQVRVYIEEYRAEVQANHPVSEVVPLQYAKAADLAPFVSGLFPRVKISSMAGDKAGAVGLSGPELDVAQAKQAIAKLDQPSDGSEDVIFKLYELKYASGPEVVEFIKKAIPSVEAVSAPEIYSTPRPRFNPLSASLGGGASAFFNQGGSSSNGSGGLGQNGSQGMSGGMQVQPAKPGDKSKAVVLKGRKPDIEQALQLLATLDVKPIQVVVECKVLEVSPSFKESLGLDWNLTNTQTLTEGAPGAGGIGFGRFTRTTPLSFSTTLNAGITKGEAKILADPRIQASDNEDAFIFVGDTVRIAIPTVGVFGAQGVTPLEFPIGIILTIRPRVSADGSITMHVNPVVSTITSINNDGLPQTASREAETTAVVRDGETMAIGGLIRDDYSRTIKEIPILSKIPFLGELFRNRTTTHNKVDVIVTLTPHIVHDTDGSSK
ncbi:MAG TPA: secretin N-terminal domain-containing protein [Fimbriimonas sp.]|nr:secretin N-terminal domain-containing protein [Fimbriimonas sp.]